jgi:hypothetical protein
MTRAIEEDAMATMRACGRLGATLGWAWCVLIAGGCAPIAWTSPGVGDAAHADAGYGADTQHDGGVPRGLGGGAVDDAGAPIEDAAMALPDAPREPFTFEPAETRITVHAGGRAILPVRVVRAPEVLAWIELHAQGLPRGVAALYAIGPDPTEIAVILEASDTAIPVVDAPFTLEANAGGARRTRRILLTVVPERDAPEQ